MQKRIYTAADACREAVKLFNLDNDAPPRMIPTGLEPIDRSSGGLIPQQGGLLLADQNVGKSSTFVAMLLKCPEPSAYFTCEDPIALVGCRLLAARSGYNALDIQLKRGVPYAQILATIERYASGMATLDDVQIVDCIGASLNEIKELIKATGDRGAKLGLFDYLQKVRGHSDKRNEEVARTFSETQVEAAKSGMAWIAASQVTDVMPGTMPYSNKARDTRDIVNEARFILGACRPCLKNPAVDPNRIDFFLEKSSHGGGGLRFSMYRDASGTLRTTNEIQDGEAGSAQAEDSDW